MADRDVYFDKLEIMSSRERGKFLDRHLEESMAHAYRHAPSAREIIDRAGLAPSQIRTVKDLEKLPITRKTDLIELQKAHPPYGGFLCIPPEDVERVFISPGPIYEPHQPHTIKWFAKSFYAAGFRRGDVVINAFTYHMSPAGILFHEGLRDCQATPIPMGVGNTEIQIQTMLDMKVTGFVGTPSFLISLIKRAEEMGHNFKRDFVLQKILEAEYNISTAQAYAVTELGGAIAYECKQKSGMHFMDDYVIEIVDPETGKQLGPNTVGEIVATPILNKTWGLIRFGTGDMSYYTRETCPCGRTADRLVAIVGRAGDATKIRGMFVVTRQVEQVFSSFEQISAYQVWVGRQEQRDNMTFKIELKDQSIDKNRLADDLNNKFQDICRVRADKIDFINSGTIPAEHKTIVDERTWE
jgi:phenylacetate-CoA ligase